MYTRYLTENNMAAPRLTQNQYDDLIKSRPAKGGSSLSITVDHELRAQLGRAGVKLPAVKEVLPGTENAVSQSKKKRRGVNVRPIMRALDQSSIRVSSGDNFFALRLDGARVLTVNEMFSILQYRKHEIFGFKKLCQRKIADAVAIARLQGGLPALHGPVRLWLYRRGQKRVDKVDMTTIFKYLIDACVREGIVTDDRDEVICDVRMQQENGEPALALRFEVMSEGYPAEGLDFELGFWQDAQSFSPLAAPAVSPVKKPAKLKPAKLNSSKALPKTNPSSKE
jgi:hypothetical protein